MNCVATNMKKFLAILLFNLVFSLSSNFFFHTLVLSAPDLGTKTGGLAEQIGGAAGYSTNVNEYTLSETIGRVIKILLSFVGTIFFALAVYAGFLWMTAQGNEDQVAKATGIIKTAIIGMIVVVAAYSITAWALIFTAQSTSLNVGQ